MRNKMDLDKKITELIDSLLEDYEEINDVDKLAKACLAELILSFYDVEPDTIKDSMELILPSSKNLKKLNKAMLKQIDFFA